MPTLMEGGVLLPGGTTVGVDQSARAIPTPAERTRENAATRKIFVSFCGIRFLNFYALARYYTYFVYLNTVGTTEEKTVIF